MAKAISRTCDKCVGVPGDNYCELCQQWFCDECKTSHLQTISTRNHTFIRGSNTKQEVDTRESTIRKDADTRLQRNERDTLTATKYKYRCCDCNTEIISEKATE
ncbi:uncharacterized protein LOC127714070 [Mytilus californianus]|uniref:uncharacterized protein LOC127714070 n=1 Tax=Mytilus californianus TaxID=6549 RepID=UPI002245BEC3|nr:uncharacterized protein LOC127714070 [Mytilus californianus]